MKVTGCSWVLAVAVAACSSGGDAPEAGTGTGVDAATGARMDAVADRGDGATESGAVVDGGTMADGGSTRAAYCMGAGPSVLVGDTMTSTTTCAGRLAEEVFRWGICSCTNLTLAGYMHTDSYDSTLTPNPTGENGGAVGVDNVLGIVGVMRVGDNLTVSGTGALNLIGVHSVRGDMNLGGPLQIAAALDVHRNARINGNITALGPMHVYGDLVTPPGAGTLGFITVDGMRRSVPVEITPPCDCAPADIIDVAGTGREAQGDNDNAAVGFNPATFDGVVGIADVTLPCGRYYADRVAGLGGITVHLSGRTALFIGGDFDLGGEFDVDLGTSGEIDVFIAGNVLGAGYLRLGRNAHPSKVRFYVAGAQGFSLVGASGLYGNLYALRAPVNLVGYMNLHGSLFAGNITAGADLDVHYDRSVLHAGDTCPPPAGGCTGCGAGTCSIAQACISGMCAGCHTDGDCCAPLVCATATGQCEPIPQ